MSFLKNKKVLILGLLSDRSIAYGIASSMKAQGAELAFTYQMEKHQGRVEKLASDFNSKIVLPCDVSSDEQINELFPKLSQHWKKFDVLVHSLAFVPKEALSGDFVEQTTRENFRIAHDISSYSFTALAKAALPYLNPNASLLTLSYLGAERTMPNYNVMGLAKASLEANVRYMSHSLGSKGIRVNAVSAGPIKTLAASGIANFDRMYDFNERHAALKRNVTIDEVGNAAAFLCSDLASGITGEITYVDGGMNITAAGSID
ncbi:MAG: enoyl-ACP reductase [Methylophilales bacterium]|jgi:enoyl-[acyl-carrier protein] reductase I|nr:enoyl-ACP reductase [Pseudomonadota bacterium]NQW34443.1 enoyl-ACP reductase [Methylophilales bacterium]HCK03426.1 enoyl-[acyl-carrier-protein] reductase FabI [Methylophilaceae bacterium]|tara:strand:- start:14773 stop:15555 length:783 start_codon:yes stop_codon:yes gene_type:complete